MEQTTTTTVMS